MAQHGDELFAQLRHFDLRQQPMLSTQLLGCGFRNSLFQRDVEIGHVFASTLCRIPGMEKIPLVLPAVCRKQDHQTRDL